MKSNKKILIVFPCQETKKMFTLLENFHYCQSTNFISHLYYLLSEFTR